LDRKGGEQIDKPIEPITAYYVFSAGQISKSAGNQYGLFTQDVVTSYCKTGYSQSHITYAINPPDYRCYPDIGSDSPAQFDPDTTGGKWAHRESWEYFTGCKYVWLGSTESLKCFGPEGEP
jgi:hypothetical protein